MIAPNLRLRSVKIPLGELASALETNAVHIALGQLPDICVEFERAHLFDQDYVLVMGEHHPLAGQAVTRELLTQFEFVLVGRFPDVEQLIAEQGLTSQVRLRVAHYLAVPMILSTSNLAVWLPRSLIDIVMRAGAVTGPCSVATLERNFSLSAVRHRRKRQGPWRAMVLGAGDAVDCRSLSRARVKGEPEVNLTVVAGGDPTASASFLCRDTSIRVPRRMSASEGRDRCALRYSCYLNPPDS